MGIRRNNTPGRPVPTEEFVAIVLSKLDIPEEDILTYAAGRNLLETRDRMQAELPIRRRDAARILHTVLRQVLEEEDEADWSAAERLRDLYTCRSCVQHIAQIYAKGILPEAKPRLFDTEAFLTLEEAQQAAERLADREKRLPVAPGRGTCRAITLEEASSILQKEGARLIDVRTQMDYAKGHRPGAENIPLEMLMRHPHIAVDLEIPIVLYCSRGYRSKLAADLLLEAGFRQVYTMPGIQPGETAAGSP